MRRKQPSSSLRQFSSSPAGATTRIRAASAAGDQLSDEHAGLDGLAQPDLVRNQQPPRRAVNQVVYQQDLMGQEIYPAGGQLPAGIRVDEVESHLSYAVVLGVVEVTRCQPLPKIRRLLQPLDGQVLHALAVTRLEQHLRLIDPRGPGIRAAPRPCPTPDAA